MAAPDFDRLDELAEMDPTRMTRKQREEATAALNEGLAYLKADTAEDLAASNASLESIKQHMSTFPSMESGNSYVADPLLRAYKLLNSGQLDDAIADLEPFLEEMKHHAAKLRDKQYQEAIADNFKKYLDSRVRLKGTDEDEDIDSFINSITTTLDALNDHFKQSRKEAKRSNKVGSASRGRKIKGDSRKPSAENGKLKRKRKPTPAAERDEDDESDPEVAERYRRINKRYKVDKPGQHWVRFNDSPEEYDLGDEDIVALIRKDWVAEKFPERVYQWTHEGPSLVDLKQAQDEVAMNGGPIEESMAYRLWEIRQRTGTKGPVAYREFDSLDTIKAREKQAREDEAREQERQKTAASSGKKDIVPFTSEERAYLAKWM